LNQRESKEGFKMYHIQDYINWCKIRGLAHSTITARYRVLIKFDQFLKRKSIFDIKKVTTKDIDDYVEFLFQEKSIITKKQRSVNQIRTIIGTVKSYFKYLFDNDYLIYNPAEKVELPKKVQYLPRGVMSETEVLQVLRQPDTKSYQGYVHKMIMEILYSTGIRNRELVNLDIYDIDFEGNTIRVREGKGKKDRIVPIGETALRMIQGYLYQERPKVAKHTEETKLILNEKGYPLKAYEVWRIVKYYVKKAGIKKKITPHSFRHTFAIHLLKNGADIISIQEMLGHSSIKTTEIYLKIHNKELKNVHNKCHPREFLKTKLKGGKEK